MIPENKKIAVRKAINTAFGVDAFDDIQQLMKGLSTALIFKIMVKGNPYLLRVLTRTDAISDPAFYFDCMKISARAELAPFIYYLNAEDRISITGFIKEKIFSIPEAREMMPHLIRELHSLPKFPYRINYFHSMENFIAKFRASGMIPENETKDLFEIYERMASVYPRDDQKNWVSCHNDLKPENIIFDGLRPWLVDWEAAFLNDRYLDLAVVANFVVKNDEEEVIYLERYFGEPADEYKLARFFVMSQILHLYYFTIFMLSGFTGKPIDMDNPGNLDFRLFNDGIWNGEISLAANDVKLQYAWIHRKEFLRKINSKRFDDSLRIIAEYK